MKPTPNDWARTEVHDTMSLHIVLGGRGDVFRVKSIFRRILAREKLRCGLVEAIAVIGVLSGLTYK